VLYQFDKKLADKVSFAEGSKVTCHLYMADMSLNPMFKCSKGGSYEGGYLASRGCPVGKFACLTTNDCVDTCGSGNCIGAPYNDETTSSCSSTDPNHGTVAEQNRLEMQKRAAIDDINYEETLENENDILEATPVIARREDTTMENTSYTKEDALHCTDPPCIELLDESENASSPYYLVPDSPHESSFDTTFSGIAAETVLKLEAMPLLPRGQVGKVCDLLTIGAYSCGPTEDEDGCRCNFRHEQACQPTFFHSGKHIKVINLVAGTVMFAGDGCECHEEETVDGFYTCDFKVKEAVPKITINKEATFAFNL
jgi:hypothetical protein